MTFSRAYSASPLCSPTRAAILTGLSPARIGLTAPQAHLPTVSLKATQGSTGSPKQKAIQPKSATRLDPRLPSLAKTLQRAGYATGHFGKWHLGPDPYSPLAHGFEVDLPHHAGPGPAGSYIAPWKFKQFDHDPEIPNEHIEDRMAKEAVRWMKEQDGPFFLNYWMFSVHGPFDAKAELIESYRQKVNPNDPQRNPVYAAMIESMDDAIGTLLDAVDQLGIAEETIIVFTSDNGGNMYNEVEGSPPTSNHPLRGGKATMYEGGVRVPTIVAVPGATQAGSRSDALIQSEDFFPTLLEVLQLDPDHGQIFDGVSFAGALHGEAFQRNAIFQYFPHSPPIPDWLPPSLSIHQGDWKLIRLFHDGDDGEHSYRLYHLGKDLGEQNNVA
ncbi:MAG: sulfatase, partial [Verrucomicrobiota bacterium]